MAEINRKQMEALYRIFDKYAINDQRSYYESTVAKYRKSASQVNFIRAFLAFMTGLASAAAGLVVQYSFDGNGQCLLGAQASRTVVGIVNSLIGTQANCSVIQGVVVFLMLMAVVTPAVAGGFNILADLYQWDRLITIYDTALENIEVADSRSPLQDMDDLTYLASLHAYAEGTLTVMYDETAQWGQLIRTPPQLEKFIADEAEKANKASGGTTSDASNTQSTQSGAGSSGTMPTVPNMSPPGNPNPPASSTANNDAAG